MTKATGGQVNYYLASVLRPRRVEQVPYQAECEDIIQALGMTFDEGCAFKALWRTAAARLSTPKPGRDPLDQAIYDAEKIVHYGNQMRLSTEFLLSLKNKATTESDAMVEYNPKKHGPIMPHNTIPQAPTQTWHPYDGTGLGGRGFYPDTKVYVRFASGIGSSTKPELVSNLDWTWYYNPPQGGDIIAYRFA